MMNRHKPIVRTAHHVLFHRDLYHSCYDRRTCQVKTEIICLITTHNLAYRHYNGGVFSFSQKNRSVFLAVFRRFFSVIKTCRDVQIIAFVGKTVGLYDYGSKSAILGDETIDVKGI